MMNANRPLMARPWTLLQSWCNLVLGIILFIAPWFTVTWSHGNSSWNAWILGVLIVLAALWALATPSNVVPHWINLIFGIWVFISPWVLGYAALSAIAWAAWIIGALVVILSVWTIVETQRSPSRAAL
jgi:SPW repeat-containing protein